MRAVRIDLPVVAVKKILVKFWLLRFAQVFVGAGAALGLLEFVQRGMAGFSWPSVLGWAALTATLTASISAHWAWKRQCRLVFKEPAGR